MQLRRYDDDVAPVTLQFQVETAAGGHVTASNDGSQSTATSNGERVDITRPVSMQPTVAMVQIALDAPNTAKVTDPWPDLRGQLYEVRVVDAELAEQIAKGELAIPR